MVSKCCPAKRCAVSANTPMAADKAIATAPQEKPTTHSTPTRRNLYKVEKWSRDGQRIEEMEFDGNSLAKAQRIFENFIKKRPRVRLTIRQRSCGALQEWPPP